MGEGRGGGPPGTVIFELGHRTSDHAVSWREGFSASFDGVRSGMIPMEAVPELLVKAATWPFRSLKPPQSHYRTDDEDKAHICGYRRLIMLGSGEEITD